MKAIATENIVIGTLAGIGVIVLLVMFVYVVKQIMRNEYCSQASSKNSAPSSRSTRPLPEQG